MVKTEYLKLCVEWVLPLKIGEANYKYDLVMVITSKNIESKQTAKGYKM